jgi:guanylate kinase
MRPQEIDGTHYFFKTDEEFEKLISEDAFLEYANIFGNRYGTLVDQVELLLNKKKDIIFDIDWQGARALKHRMPNDVITIYILPPSIQALKQRLELRSQDSKETIETRMKEAEAECAHYIEYDYVIINDHFEDSLEKLQSIVKAERIKCHRQENLTDFVKSL